MYLKRPRTKQPTGAAQIDWSNPITRGLLDAWLPGSMAHRSVLGRKPISTGPIGLRGDRFGVGAYGLANAVQYDVGEWSESGPYSFVAVCAFFSYGSTCSVVRKDGSEIPVQVANATVRSVGWSPVATLDNYYPQYTGPKNGVLVSNRESPAMKKMYVDGTLVATDSSFSAYGSTSNPLCFLGTESNSEIFTAGVGLFYGGIAFGRALTGPEIVSISKNPWQIFRRRRIAFAPPVAAQYARPTADVSTGTWVSSLGGTLAAAIDETPADDADYISTTYGSICEVALGSLADPAVSTGHKVRYRIAADAGGLIVRLRQGTTTIASWTHAPAPTALTTFEQILSGAEADAITDYTALKLQFEAY